MFLFVQSYLYDLNLHNILLDQLNKCIVEALYHHGFDVSVMIIQSHDML